MFARHPPSGGLPFSELCPRSDTPRSRSPSSTGGTPIILRIAFSQGNRLSSSPRAVATYAPPGTDRALTTPVRRHRVSTVFRCLNT